MKTRSQGCLDDGTMLTKSCSLKVFGRTWKNASKMDFLERVNFCVMAATEVFQLTENEVKVCCLMVQSMVHGYVGCSC